MKVKLNKPAFTRAKMIGLPEPVTIKAAAPKEGEQAGPPTFSGIAYSGGIVDKRTVENVKLDSDYIIDLKGMKKARNVAVNLGHSTEHLVGHGDDVKISNQVEIAGPLSQPTASRDQVAGAAANGFPWEFSIEAGLSKPRKLAAGKSEIVNGRTVNGPLIIFQSSTLTGGAFVSHGADDGNLVTIAATADTGEKTMNEFEKYVASLGLDPESISDEARTELQAAFDVKSGKKSGNGKRKSFRELADEERQENTRIDSITKMGHDAMRESPLYIDQIEQAVEDAIDTKMSERDFELSLLRNTRMKAGAFKVTGRGEQNAEVIEAALAMASGLPKIEDHYSEAVLHAVDKNRMRGFSIQQLLMQVAHQNGYTCRAGERIGVHNIRSVLEYCFPPIHARMAGFSTISLPNILGNVANKNILAGYMEGDRTWEEIAEVKPVSNFYQQTHYRMLDNLEYEEVGSGGELHHGTLGEESYTTQAKTYGKMLGITRTQIINDDAGAFSDLRQRLGNGASKKFANVFWAAYMNNASFYTSALTNYITGSTTNLGTDGVGLGLMVAAFRNMTSPAADGLKRVGQDINPTKILVPTELEANANINYRNQNLGAVANSSANIYQNRFRPVVQWRLSNSSYTGYSTTAYYMYGDEVKPMTVTFLNGNRTPIVESTDADFDVLGILFRGYHDFGCDKGEYLAGVKSKGAA